MSRHRWARSTFSNVQVSSLSFGIPRIRKWEFYRTTLTTEEKFEAGWLLSCEWQQWLVIDPRDWRRAGADSWQRLWRGVKKCTEECLKETWHVRARQMVFVAHVENKRERNWDMKATHGIRYSMHATRPKGNAATNTHCKQDKAKEQNAWKLCRLSWKRRVVKRRNRGTGH